MSNRAENKDDTNRRAATEEIEEPYPIRRLFIRRVVPSLILSAVLLMAGGWFMVNYLELRVYLETTLRRIETTARLAKMTNPKAWQRLVEGDDPRAVLAEPDGQELAKALASLSADGHTEKLKIFNERHITIFSTDPRDIGVREENQIMKNVLLRNEPAIESTELDKQRLYEIFAPLTIGQQSRIVFEVYEPADVLDKIIVRSFAEFVAMPLAILLFLGLWLSRIVGRAQVDIDRRVEAQRSLRKQLERFVSVSAAGAARLSHGGNVPTSRTSIALFYSDVRDFTSLAEFHPPKATVEFLNELMTLQVEVIQRHGGDVDKMIGDAVLARFEGSDRETHAVQAAQEILTLLRQRPLVREIGIGIYDGEAIIGAIGPAERQDFTVIGDSVNLAARLCSLAEKGELVVEQLALR
ncbi:MAG: adenylate/guanylate cyclase domain-containing protein, partial [Gallionella sp.]|nr:adenylate/guanylate cyclase domain-containing protein [Gallionella sp.]